MKILSATIALAIATCLSIVLVATAATVSSSGCSGQALHTMTGAFAACEKADLGILVAPGVTLLGDVAEAIKGNSPTLESDFDGLAKTLGVSAVQCAIAAVLAVIEAPAQMQGGSAGSGGLATNAEPPGAVRAKAWLQKQLQGAQP